MRRWTTRTGLPVVGMVGGGQLARMTHQAAIALGQSLRVLAESPDDGAALVAADVRDRLAHRSRRAAGVRQGLRRGHLRPRARAGRAHPGAGEAEGVKVLPGADALRLRAGQAGDAGAARRARRRRCRAGRRSRRPRTSPSSPRQAGWPVVVKADARRVRRARASGCVGRGRGRGCSRPASTLIVEERVPLRAGAGRGGGPLAVRAGRGVPGGRDRAAGRHLRRGARAGARPADERGAARPSSSPSGIATELGRGRPARRRAVRDRHRHRSSTSWRCARTTPAHWTIEGARTSQFEQHLRAVLDYPMGDTSLTAPVVVMANVLGGAGRRHVDRRAAAPPVRRASRRAKVHLYGKQVRPGRKIGHVTVLGDDLATVRASAARAARWLQEGE